MVAKDKISGIVNTYALKIDDIETFSESVNAVWNNPDFQVPATGNIEYDEDQKMKKIHKNLALKYEANKNDLEKYFLQKFGNFGISLFKADNNLSNWSQIELDSDDSGSLTTKLTPCN